jgi:hypothetical protein
LSFRVGSLNIFSCKNVNKIENLCPRRITSTLRVNKWFLKF